MEVAFLRQPSTGVLYWYWNYNDILPKHVQKGTRKILLSQREDDGKRVKQFVCHRRFPRYGIEFQSFLI